MKNGMVVLTAGIGKRIGRPFPKQFLLLGGKPLIVHVLEKARVIPAIERVVITCPDAHLDETRRLIANHGFDDKFSCIIGGGSRQESVYKGLVELGDCESVVIHEYVEDLLERDELVNVQLPQKFDRAALMAAHEAARRDDAFFTEDASLFHRYAGTPVRILPGSERNIKITVPTDIVTAEAIYADVLGRRS